MTLNIECTKTTLWMVCMHVYHRQTCTVNELALKNGSSLMSANFQGDVND